MAKIDYKLNVVDSLGIYDMILGKDFVSSPMKAASAQVSDSFHIEDPKGINYMVRHIAGDMYKTILQAKYKKANLEKKVEDNCLQLNSSQ
eukprot:7245225-Ditylum_brightwellii.AAC.1